MGKMSSGLQTMLNTFYIDTLKDADSISNNVPEKKNLYLSAFHICNFWNRVVIMDTNLMW